MNFHSRSYSDRQPQLEQTSSGIIKIHSDSQKSLDRLFNPQPGPVPLRQRNLPSSFFNPTAKPATVIRQPLHYRNFSSPAFMPNNNNNNNHLNQQKQQNQQQQHHHHHQHQHQSQTHQHNHQHNQHEPHQHHHHHHQHEHHQQQQYHQSRQLAYGDGYSSSHEHIASPTYTNGANYQVSNQINLAPQMDTFVQEQHSANFKANSNQAAQPGLTCSAAIGHSDNQLQCQAARQQQQLQLEQSKSLQQNQQQPDRSNVHFVSQTSELARASTNQVHQTAAPQEMQDVTVQCYEAKSLHVRSNYHQHNQANVHRSFPQQQGQFSNSQGTNCTSGAPAVQFANGLTNCSNSHVHYEYQNNCPAGANGQNSIGSLNTIHQGDQAYYSPSAPFTGGHQPLTPTFGAYSSSTDHYHLSTSSTYQHRQHQFNQIQFNQNQDQPGTVGYQAG